jgi:hypothetical protein
LHRVMTERSRLIYDRPPTWVRVVISTFASCLASYILYSNYAEYPGFTADFGQWHLGARTLLSGENPYLTNGPGLQYHWPWSFSYPAPAILLVTPLAWMPEVVGAMVFVSLSTFVMVMGLTRTGLFLIPLLLSVPFHLSAGLAQWSLLLTAAVFYPPLAFLLVVKPQAALPVAMALREKRGLWIAAFVAGALVIASLVLLPDWPRQWLGILLQRQNHEKYLSPLVASGGIVLLLALLRWRRREAWLLLGMAVLPQSQSFYFLLPLFTIPANLSESLILLFASTLGIYLGGLLMPPGIEGSEFYRWSINVAVFSTYIPCLIMVLRRANIPGGQSPHVDILNKEGRGHP